MLAGMSQFISICCDSFVYNRFTLGIVHEHIGMKPIGRAASDWECYLHLAPLFLFPKKDISELCKDLLSLFFVRY